MWMSLFVLANSSFPTALCEAQSVGLVRYPATLAPTSGSQSIMTQCADNARQATTLNVTCNSDGSWSGSPQCQCEERYQTVTVNERQICQGKFSPAIPFSTAPFPVTCPPTEALS